MARFNLFGKRKDKNTQNLTDQKSKIYEEVEEFIQEEVAFGFDNKLEILEAIWSNGYENEDDFDETHLKALIDIYYNQHQQESEQWTYPTDFDKLAKAFDELNQEKIIALHKAGYTKQDGYSDVKEVLDLLKPHQIRPQGFCFYHTQDLLRAISPHQRNLFLAFDDIEQQDEKAILIGKRIVTKLKTYGFNVSWNESIEQRIEIRDILWRKTPDNQAWGIPRAMKHLAEAD